MPSEIDPEYVFQRLAAFIDAGARDDTAERLARLCLALAIRCDTRETFEAALRAAEAADGNEDAPPATP